MIALNEAQQRLLNLAAPLPVVEAPLCEAAGRWTAADIVSLRTQPARDLSAMDGYAIRFAERPGPWRLIGESAAGRAFPGSVAPGEAVRIFTGAAVPEGCDTVLIQEDSHAEGERIAMTGDGPLSAGAHIRQQGSDFAAGETLIAAGCLLTPAAIALAALAGHGHLPVRRRPRVVLISTGDELREPGSNDGDDTIPASNAPMLAAMFGGIADVTDLGIVADRLDALTKLFDSVRAFDLIVTTGGASVGDHDLVRPALSAAGAQLDFWKIAMRPGKPVIAGTLGNAAVLGLPGNPVSAYVTAFLLALPLMRHLAGARDPYPHTRPARLAGSLPANGPRLDHRRGYFERDTVTPAASNDSAMLRALAQSNALIVREPGAGAATEGDLVEIYHLPQQGG